MDKRKVIQLAKDSGLVFNTELMQSEVYPHHRKSILVCKYDRIQRTRSSSL